MTDSLDIQFLESYEARTSVVPEVIDHLVKDLNHTEFSHEEKDEIILAMDEAMTNAIQATSNQRNQSGEMRESRDITVRYSITPSEFNATIIDHGRGLDIFDILKKVPDQKSGDYYDQVTSYATEKEKKKITVRLNGEEVTPGGIGAGLRIILAFMDSVTIDLIDKEKILSDSISETTDGTIFNMKRGRRT
jgi:anti-sigma regulatory factor (Ser/Thr protein kinase)